MEKLYLGIELDDSGCNLAWLDSEKRMVQKLQDRNGDSEIPAYLCLDTVENRWYAGKEAEAFQGREGCIVLNRLVSLFRSGQYLEACGECYTDEDMLREFLNYVLQEASRRCGLKVIGSLVVCLSQVQIWEAEKISRICRSIGVDPMAVHVLNRQECFMYYLMSQKHEIWSNVSLLFDYGKNGLFCYEVSLIKGLRPVTAQAHMEKVTGVPPVELTRQEGEERNAVDRWFSSLAEKKMAGKIVSSVMLCGEGFSDLSWTREFIKSISSQKSRKVYQTDVLYGMGAAFAAYHIAEKHKNFPYRCICDGRISVTVSIFVDEKEGSEQLILVQAGTSCYEARSSIDLNLVGQKSISLYVRNTGAQESYRLTMDLSSFVADGRERTKIRLSIAFSKTDAMVVRIEDLGFGEIYPSTGQIMQQCYKV